MTRFRMRNGATLEFGGKPGPDYFASSTRWFVVEDGAPIVWRPRNPDTHAAFLECMAEVARLDPEARLAQERGK